MQIWAETGKSALPIHNYSRILYQFLTFTQNLKRSRFVIRKVNYALYNVLINTLEAKITYYGSRLLFKFHY